MGYMKRVMTILLVIAMTLSLMLSASAATSPTTAPTVTPTPTPGVNPEFDVVTEIDNNKQDHDPGTKVDTVVEGTSATTIKVETTNDRFVLENARNAENVEVPISQVGDGINGILDSESGRNVLYTTIQSGASEVVIAENAYKGSNVKRLTLKSKKFRVKKNAFKGTNKKNMTIRIDGVKKAANFAVAKGSFAGLSKKATISVSKKMSAKEFRKLKNKLKKAGFKGKIKRS